MLRKQRLHAYIACKGCTLTLHARSLKIRVQAGNALSRGRNPDKIPGPREQVPARRPAEGRAWWMQPQIGAESRTPRMRSQLTPRPTGSRSRGRPGAAPPLTSAAPGSSGRNPGCRVRWPPPRCAEPPRAPGAAAHGPTRPEAAGDGTGRPNRTALGCGLK